MSKSLIPAISGLTDAIAHNTGLKSGRAKLILEGFTRNAAELTREISCVKIQSVVRMFLMKASVAKIRQYNEVALEVRIFAANLILEECCIEQSWKISNICVTDAVSISEHTSQLQQFSNTLATILMEEIVKLLLEGMVVETVKSATADYMTTSFNRQKQNPIVGVIVGLIEETVGIATIEIAKLVRT